MTLRNKLSLVVTVILPLGKFKKKEQEIEASLN